jgi:hypothetical protein
VTYWEGGGAIGDVSRMNDRIKLNGVGEIPFMRQTVNEMGGACSMNGGEEECI